MAKAALISPCLGTLLWGFTVPSNLELRAFHRDLNLLGSNPRRVQFDVKRLLVIVASSRRSIFSAALAT